MNIEQQLKDLTVKAVKSLFNIDFKADKVVVSLTRKEFDGDYTIVVFPFVKLAKKSPDAVGNELGEYFKTQLDLITGYNVIKGFLNIELDDSYWLEFLGREISNSEYGKQEPKIETVVVEYCGPNTNKPLHLGHIRNMLLGHSVSNILAYNGYDVKKVNIYNDRGIAICKSMLAWQKFGNDETPENTGEKGDHLVGKYYVEFDKHYKKQITQLIETGKTKTDAEKEAPLIQEAREMLRKWEAGDEAVLALWKTMNGWVYTGFEETYDSLGVDFEKAYYESDTYVKGKAIVEEGLEKGAYFKKDDGSVWVDLEGDGLDQKILLRSDGTSVYLTQDLGVAQERYNDYKMDRSIYVVANEQDYHFKVLKLTLQKLGKPYADGIFHLSYGMVDLPSGKMKSREGTVVDADELIQEMIDTAEEHTKELGKIDDFDADEANALYQKIGLGALKFFMLRVDPKKRMLFNPKESIDFHGTTGPFVQYTYARIQSVLHKAGEFDETITSKSNINNFEKELVVLLHQYPNIIKEAGANLDPSTLVNYCYELAKTYNKFYHECPILNAEDETIVNFRVAISSFTASVLLSGFNLLGIKMPERM